MGYWDETDRIIAENGGRNPVCSVCGQEMFPIDDHGRFSCGCRPLFGTMGGFAAIPQVDASAMTNAEKAEISPINRLESEPTEAERKVLEYMLRGPAAMDEPGYAEALAKLDE